MLSEERTKEKTGAGLNCLKELKEFKSIYSAFNKWYKEYTNLFQRYFHWSRCFKQIHLSSYRHGQGKGKGNEQRDKPPQFWRS